MLSLLIITSNEREQKILDVAFSQINIKVIVSDPSYSSYIKAIQYKPDVILIEFPKYYTEHINFVKNVQNGLKRQDLLVISYGAKFEASEEKYLLQCGVTTHLLRPLKFSLVMQIIEKHLTAFSPDKLTWLNEDNENDDYFSYLGDIYSKETLPTQKIEILVNRVKSLMAFPTTVAQVLQLSSDPNSGAAELSKVIEADPVISTSVIKMANTIIFAKRSGQTSTVKNAIIRIGFKETKHIVMTMRVMDSMSSSSKSLGFDRNDFWTHSLAVAIIAENIAKKTVSINSSEVFLAGLLHDFGIMVFDEFFEELFADLLEKTTDSAKSFIETEINEIGITHNDIVKSLFESWKIPGVITKSIDNSFKINSFFKEANSEAKGLSSEETIGLIINSADILAKSLLLGSECDQFISHLGKDRLKALNINEKTINDEFISKVKMEIEMYQKLLKIDSDIVELEKPLSILTFSDSGIVSPATLYVNQKGHNCTELINVDKIPESEEAYDAFIYWANDKSDNSIVAKISEVNGKVGKLPLIVMDNDPSKEDRGVKYLNSEIDLRMIEIALNEATASTQVII
jgi:HD-like signal output (HDOD) protein